MNKTQNLNAAFTELDLGSVQPTSVPMETVEVEVSVSDLVMDFGRAFVSEAYRVNPLRAEQVNLTSEEMDSYCNFLLAKRIEVVNNNCPDFRRLKTLYIPSFIQYVLSMIGEVRMRDRGLLIKPTMKSCEVITLEEAFKISEKIGSFERDLQIVQDAMPRDISGNKDVMSTALIAGYVRALNPVEHVSATYVSAFLGMKLRQESAFQVLYRVQYDDIAFIAAALTSQKGLF